MPFIYQETRNWEFQSQIIKQNNRKLSEQTLFNFYQHSEARKFIRALEFIHRMGIVEGNQLFELLGLKKTERQYLTRINLLVCHQIVCKQYTLNVYTLHPNASTVLIDLPKLQNNYWVVYDTIKVLQILTSIEFYLRFREGKKNCYLKGGIPPFPSVLQLNGRNYNIYVLRGMNYAFEEYLRLNTVQPTTTEASVQPNLLFLICENINHLAPFIQSIENANIKVRIIDESYLKNNGDITNSLHYIKDGQIFKETIQVTN